MTKSKDEQTLAETLEIQTLQNERTLRQQSCRELSTLLKPLRTEVERIESGLEKHLEQIRQIELKLAKLENRIHVVTPQEVASRRQLDKMAGLEKMFLELSEDDRRRVVEQITGKERNNDGSEL
jgi:septal ring factor EnvC (AmiA/AmiB activator)